MEIEILKNLYAAINRHDIQALMEFYDSDIECIEFAGHSTGGIYRGIAEVRAHFSQALETWTEGACTPEQFMIVGDKVVALVHVKVKLKARDQWVEGRIADVFRFQSGKIILVRNFMEQAQALEWAAQA